MENRGLESSANPFINLCKYCSIIATFSKSLKEKFLDKDADLSFILDIQFST